MTVELHTVNARRRVYRHTEAGSESFVSHCQSCGWTTEPELTPGRTEAPLRSHWLEAH